MIAFSAWVSVPPLQSAAHVAEQVARDDAALEQIAELRTALADWQNYFEPVVAQATQQNAASLTSAAILVQKVLDAGGATVDGLATVDLTARSQEVATARTTFQDALLTLRTAADQPVGPESLSLVAVERAAYSQLWDVTGTAATELREMRDVHHKQSAGHLGDGERRVLAGYALAAIAIVFAAFVFGGRAHRRSRAEEVMGRRERFGSSLQDGLEMARTETVVYGVVQRALHYSVAGLQVELLVADSSRAHFHQVLHTGAGEDEERSGCSVVSPVECPAVVRSETIVFPTSTAIDACPYLQDRPSGPCSAACVPVSIAGETVGVFHATGVEHHPPDDTEIGYLEATTRRAGERVTVLRAFERSETQASTDPLTGLLNRRSLENQVRDLRQDGTALAVAYGDLDHFKVLNDTHGHEAGDQALRLFSQVVRDSIRPNDIAARYGGEEFVIVLPDCDTTAATIVLERVREHLVLALRTGRVPAFTVSFGLASSTAAETFDDTVAQADHALLAAKTAGRNRVVVATEPDQLEVLT
jgi:diguanylate cyclase (GGDEF)-like protein